MNRLRVLELHWGFALGGVAKYAALLDRLGAGGDIDIGHLVIQAPSFRMDGKTLAGMPHTLLSIQSRLDPSWIRKTIAAVRGHKPDLVMTHGYNGHVVAAVCSRLTRRRWPLVASWHGPYHPNAGAGRFFAPLVNRLAYAILRRDMIGIVSVADYCRHQLLEHGIPAGRTRTIHNGLPSLAHDAGAAGRHLRAEWGIPENALVIGLASRMDPVKGVDVFLEAWQRLAPELPPAYAVLCGEGAALPALRERANRLPGAERILFTGYREDVADCMAAFDIFVLPSFFEYHSIALLEAMRAGCAIVATDVGGNAESVRDGLEGLLVPARDRDALAQAIARLAASETLRRTLGAAAHERRERLFTVEDMLRQTRDWLFAMHEESLKRGLRVV